MFNVIIITIFLGSSKPSAVDFDWIFFHPSPPVLHETCYYDSPDDDNDDEDDDKDHGYDGYDEDNDDDLDTEDVESEDDGIDNDLERKIEEFIAKVNRKWREELLAEKLLCIEAAASVPYEQ